MLPRSLSAINKIIIHCSATPNGRDHDALDVNFWHGHDRVKRGLKPFRRQESFRKDFNPDMDHIGYHYVIRLDGSVESGRALWEVGAHAQGQNSGSVGICMIGTHQVAEHKTCPGFSVPAWERNHYTPEPENLLRDCNEPNLNHANNHAKN
jgi:hypothetical protein